jgi:DNA-binding response OmpR family regulator
MLGPPAGSPSPYVAIVRRGQGMLFPVPKVIAVTAARGRFNRLTAARHVGAHHTLVKPFGMTDLLTAVRDVLAG